MEAEAIARIEELTQRANAIRTDSDGRQFLPRGVEYEITTRRAETVLLSDLDSLSMYLTSWGQTESDGDAVLIESPTEVRVISHLNDDANRQSVVKAEYTDDAPKHHFNGFIEHESFMIWLQTAFQETVDQQALLSIVGSIKDEEVKTVADDGVTQHVTVAAGVTRVGDAEVPRKVILRPMRTFPEIEEQPASTFLVRLRRCGQAGFLPQVGMFETDGGQWTLAAKRSIRDYLRDKIENSILM